MVPPAEKEVTVLSQDFGVPSSSIAGDDDHIACMRAVGGSQKIVNVGKTHGEVLLHGCDGYGNFKTTAVGCSFKQYQQGLLLFYVHGESGFSLK